MEKDNDLGGPSPTEVATAGQAVPAPELPHAAPTFECAIVGGDARPDPSVPLDAQSSYIVELRILAPWQDIPAWIRTMSTRARVTFVKAEHT